MNDNFVNSILDLVFLAVVLMKLIYQSLEELSHTQEGTVLVIHQGQGEADFSNLDYNKIKGLFIWQGGHKLNVLALNLDKFFFGTLVEWEEMLKTDTMWDKLASQMSGTEFVPNYIAFEFLDNVADLMSVGEYVQYPKDAHNKQEHRYIDAIDQWASLIDESLLPEGTMISEIEDRENYKSATVRIK